MAEKKVGKVVFQRPLSDILELFRITPEDGSSFPEYKAGQYIALSRDDCRLTKKVVAPDGQISYVYDLDDSGNVRCGSVTHSYSISSAPFETKQHRYLEFYVVLEMVKLETPGRLSESLFHIDPEVDNKLLYVNKIVGEFTLDKRARGFQNIVMVGTGTGLAPFASMLKQLHHEALQGSPYNARVTLIHANRTYEELGYHNELQSIEREQKVDFVYVPSVSRPTSRDFSDSRLGKGRANNILRAIFGMQLKEEQDLQEAIKAMGERTAAEKVLKKTVRPVLPSHHDRQELLQRMNPGSTVILTCGNPGGMDDIKYIAEANHVGFEKEEW